MKSKLFVFFTFLSLNLLGQSTPPTEQDIYLSSVKAKDVEKQISESEQFKKCKDDQSLDTPQKVEACIKTAMKNVDPEEFAEKLDLKSYDRDASKDSKSIREYLSKRIEKIIYGTDPDEENAKIKKAKIADHALYAKLYRSQIGKNILMEVSNYCLSNLGLKDRPLQLVNHCLLDFPKKDKKTGDIIFDDQDNVKTWGKHPQCSSNSTKVTSSSNTSYGPNLNGNVLTFEKKFKDENGKRTFDPNDFDIEPKISSSTLWTELTEFTVSEDCINKETKDGVEYCAQVIKKTKADGSLEDIKILTRNNSFLDAVKEVEFKLGAEYMKHKYNFCAFTAIKNMCEVYRCRNVYDKKTKLASQSTNDNKIRYCEKVLGILKPETLASYDVDYPADYSPPSEPGDFNSSGLIACGVVERLKEYRKVINALDKLDEDNKKLARENTRGFRTDMYSGGFAAGSENIEDITTLSSSELTEKVNLGLKKDEVDELRKECIDNSGKLIEEEKCKALVTDLDESQEKEVIAELEAETQAYLKRIDSLKGDKESLKQYLINNGLSKYAGKVEEMDDDILMTLIKDEYKSQRAALKKNMMEKYNRIKESKNPSAGEDLATQQGTIASENLANLEKQKERIQTLFQYNNVISSYLEAEKSDGSQKSKTDLSYIRQAELDGMNEFGNDETKAKYEQYNKDLGTDGAGRSDAQMEVDLKFIDNLLGD